MMVKSVEYLIVDTSAFIKNAALQEIGTNIITVEDVIGEIKSKRQLRRLCVLPYDLQVKDVFPENIKFVTEFSKKTGDYPSLSATDLKVVGLTYQLEKEHVGSQHLKQQPEFSKTVEATDHSLLNARDIAGFYLPKKDEAVHSDEFESFSEEEEEECTETQGKKEDEVSQDEECSSEEFESFSEEEGEEWDKTRMAKEKVCQDMSPTLAEVLIEIKGNEVNEEEDFSANESEDTDEEGGGWITPDNISKVKRQMNGSCEVPEDKPVKIACLTTDFAMQNLLKQIGLNCVTMDGMLINQVRTYILRCYACFKITSVMTKVFCPNCGNKTLKRVGVTIDPDGKQRIHINYRRPLTARGKRFSLPMPKGGKHAMNPILCEDQRIPQQRLSKLARTTNDPMNPDYIAGFSPFVMRDVTSKSVMLGLHRKGDFKYWMKKNPNEPMKHKKKK